MITFKRHSDQAGELANVLAKIADADDMEITVRQLHRLGSESYMETEDSKTELLADMLADILSTHGRPFGQS